MSNKANTTEQTKASAVVLRQPSKMGQTFGACLDVVYHTAMAASNAAEATAELTAVARDKAKNYRAQMEIIDTMEHNALISQLNEQAKALGIDL